MKYRVKYYSLVEMLLVISIIMVLCGLVLAAVMSGREKSRTLNCLSNVSQMHSAFQSFAEDNKKTIGGATIGIFANGMRWTTRILQPTNTYDPTEKGYIPKEVATCPSDREGLLKYKNDTNRENYFNGLCASSPSDIGIMGNYLDGQTLKIRLVKRPSETIYYGDTGGKVEKSAYYLFKSDADDKLITRRHKKLANVLYFDGHAKSLNKAELATSLNKITKTFTSDYKVE